MWGTRPGFPAGKLGVGKPPKDNCQASFSTCKMGARSPAHTEGAEGFSLLRAHITIHKFRAPTKVSRLFNLLSSTSSATSHTLNKA